MQELAQEVKDRPYTIQRLGLLGGEWVDIGGTMYTDSTRDAAQSALHIVDLYNPSATTKPSDFSVMLERVNSLENGRDLILNKGNSGVRVTADWVHATFLENPGSYVPPHLQPLLDSLDADIRQAYREAVAEEDSAF